MDELAKALLDLDWSDMDDFSEHIKQIATDNDGHAYDVRHISRKLIEWAHDNHAP